MASSREPSLSDLRPLIDDPEAIPDGEVLFRIVSPMFVRGGRLSSQGFQDYTADMAAGHGLAGPCASVAAVSVWRAKGADPARLIDQFGPEVGVVSFIAGEARTLRGRGGDAVPQGFMMDPKDGHPWHAVMFDLRGARSKAAMKALPLISRWAWHPGTVRAGGGPA